MAAAADEPKADETKVGETKVAEAVAEAAADAKPDPKAKAKAKAKPINAKLEALKQAAEQRRQLEKEKQAFIAAELAKRAEEDARLKKEKEEEAARREAKKKEREDKIAQRRKDGTYQTKKAKANAARAAELRKQHGFPAGDEEGKEAADADAGKKRAKLPGKLKKKPEKKVEAGDAEAGDKEDEKAFHAAEKPDEDEAGDDWEIPEAMPEAFSDDCCAMAFSDDCCAMPEALSDDCCADSDFGVEDQMFAAAAPAAACANSAPAPMFRGVSRRAAPRRGKASAARVSRGTEEDVWRGLSVTKPQRHPSEHVTVTIVIYNAIADGVPSSDDVMAAIDDLEALYASCSVEGRLADPSFDFMKGDLTVKDAADITTKVATQPYSPPPAAVVNHDVFPS